jgi:FG-GAP-like repeat
LNSRRLIQSNAGATFTRITSGPVAASSGATGGAWGDFGNDGLVDLFVSFNSGTTSVLFTNNGSGNFVTDIAIGIGSGTGSSWGSAWGDYDNDGNLDLMDSVYGMGSNYVFDNNGNGTFTKNTNSAISTVIANSSGSAWAEYGYLDLFIAVRGGNNLLFHNNGDGTFTQTTGVNPVNLSGTWIGGARGDFNNDGFPDLFTGGGRPRPSISQ